jgi:hypothetical protein
MEVADRVARCHPNRRNTVTDLTRRRFVVNSAGAAAGATALGALLADRVKADPSFTESGAVIAYVGDPRSGDISLMSAEREVTVHDPQLAAQIARAAR